MDRYTIVVLLVSLGAFFQRALRDDVKWFPSIAGPWRGLIVGALQLVIAPILDAWQNGAGVAAAALTGFLAFLPTLINLVVSLTRTVAPAFKAAGPRATLLLLLMLPGCGAGKIVCPIIHVADELCPMVLVELQDGGPVEPVPAAEVRRLAAQRRAARLGDGGAQ